MKIKISYLENVLTMELFDKGKPVVPENIKPRKLNWGIRKISILIMYLYEEKKLKKF